MRITKNITIEELIKTYPQTVDILLKMGLSCIESPSAQAESLEEASMIHGININKLLYALNQAI